MRGQGIFVVILVGLSGQVGPPVLANVVFVFPLLRQKGFPRYIFRPCLSGLGHLTRLGETPRPVASVTIVSNRNLTIIESRFRIRITAIFCIMGRLPAMWKTIRYDTVVRIRMVTNRPRPVRGVGRGAIRRSGRFGGARRIPYHVGKDRKQKIGQARLR